MEHFYLAGGFGTYINASSAARIGLFPPELLPRIIALGNASAAGAYAALNDREAFEKLKAVPELTDSLELSGRSDFSELYIEAMLFS